MSARFSDTHSDAASVHLQIIRSMSFSQRIQLVDDLIMTGRELSLSSLRERFPNATHEELQRRLSTLLLGADLAFKVYGPEPFPPTVRR